ncbi:hypothetical protein [Actinomadura latina]|uniref:Uncharacterized protein n=1 Tax=Actinomadura latina TaxID=163603 RepID=A0A846Z700_9ACTN|nr:hypothetical protein [Actinomadura latina]NKZ06173.1 hypothetical protein [Actinomadura latina]
MTAQSHGDLHEHLERLVREARDTALADLAQDEAGNSAVELIQGARRFLADAMAALADVLDAHRPVLTSAGGRTCPECETAAPCPTVHRVAAALASHGARRGAPLDRGAAWARAEAHFNESSSGGSRRLISLADLGAFYVARGVRVRLAEPPRVPAPDAETVLVIEKTHGRMSRWPLLSEADLIVQYRRYLHGEPMILDGWPTAERPARSRFFRKGAWTIPNF